MICKYLCLEKTMPLSYYDVMSHTAYLQKVKIVPYTGYNAILYARWLPFAIMVPLLAAIGMALSLFLPWLSIGNTDFVKNPITSTGFQIAGSGTSLPGGTFSFPLWLLVVLGIALIILSGLLLWGKALTFLLSLSIN